MAKHMVTYLHFRILKFPLIIYGFIQVVKNMVFNPLIIYGYIIPIDPNQVSVQPSLHALCPKARLEALLGGLWRREVQTQGDGV